MKIILCWPYWELINETETKSWWKVKRTFEGPFTTFERVDSELLSKVNLKAFFFWYFCYYIINYKVFWCCVLRPRRLNSITRVWQCSAMAHWHHTRCYNSSTRLAYKQHLQLISGKGFGVWLRLSCSAQLCCSFEGVWLVSLGPSFHNTDL